MTDAARADVTPAVCRVHLVAFVGLGIILVLVAFVARAPQLAHSAAAERPVSVEAAERVDIAPSAQTTQLKERVRAAAARDESDSAPGWPKPGDPIVIPRGAVSSYRAPAAPVVRFDASGCQACLTETCNREVSEGGDLGDAVHMIGCMRLVDDSLCVKGVQWDPFTNITVPALPSGKLTEATRALIACGAQCPCWASSAAP